MHCSLIASAIGIAQCMVHYFKSPWPPVKFFSEIGKHLLRARCLVGTMLSSFFGNHGLCFVLYTLNSCLDRLLSDWENMHCEYLLQLTDLTLIYKQTTEPSDAGC